MRTTDPSGSLFNMLNMYIGIALIALPKGVSEVGFVAAFVTIIFIDLISLAASYYLIKARNRYKKERIVDFADIGYVTYGAWMKLFCEGILFLAQISFVMA